MKAFRKDNSSIDMGIHINISHSLHEWPHSLVLGGGEALKIWIDSKNPPKVENWDAMFGKGVIYACGISESTLNNTSRYALTAGRPNDNRALLHVFTFGHLRPYFNENFPKLVVSVGYSYTYGYDGAAISSYMGTTYLLIFNPGDTIATITAPHFVVRDIHNDPWEKTHEDYIYQWDGIQFRSQVPEDYFNRIVKPWMALASKSAIDEAIEKAQYPLLRQFLQGGPPPSQWTQWGEL